jgi:hypothetical protein
MVGVGMTMIIMVTHIGIWRSAVQFDHMYWLMGVEGVMVWIGGLFMLNWISWEIFDKL